MDLWLGYTGVATAFVILAAVLTWIMIQVPGRYLTKAIMVPPVIWFGVVLYFTVQNLMGWPAVQKLPENGILLAARVEEPNASLHNPGAIYLWVRTAPSAQAGEESGGVALDPRTIFKYENPNDPRAYKMPYSRNMHEAILKAQMKMNATPGGQMKIRRNGKKAREGGDEMNRRAPVTLEVINPTRMLPKPGAEAPADWLPRQ